MKLSDLAEYEKKDALLDKKGNLLCKACKKELANVTEYGLLRNCDKCGEIKSDYNVMISIDEPNGRRTY